MEKSRIRVISAGSKTKFFKNVAYYSLTGVKGKAIPLQACTGPEVFRRLRLPDFKTVGI
jgi:hypothetical protein